MLSVLKCFVRITPQNVFRTATVTNMLRLKIHISSCQATHFETRCDTAMISDSLIGRLNSSAQQIVVKVGIHEEGDQVYFCACHDTPQKWPVQSLPYLCQ